MVAAATHRDAEVEHAHATLGVHQHVAGFQITMDDAAAVQIRQRTQDFRHERHPLGNRARPRVSRESSWLVQQRHREIRSLVAVEAVVQNADDVRMAQ
jgi:hypothetical protein